MALAGATRLASIAFSRQRRHEINPDWPPSPAGVSECHVGCATKGSWDYALNRGARLAVEFDAGRFFFCFL
ncbi:MAG: AF1514 family protein [Gammaproteobacteria bacterium]